MQAVARATVMAGGEVSCLQQQTVSLEEGRTGTAN